MDLSRRAFLGGQRHRPEKIVFRPPWALAESRFLQKCTRCNECIRVCPSHLLIVGQGGYPETDFFPGHAPEGCTFCGECLQVCKPQALSKQEGQAAWPQKALIGEDCLTHQGVVCRTCGERCEVRAISFPLRVGGVALPQLDAATCTGCGACLADCPTFAIRIHSNLPQGAA